MTDKIQVDATGLLCPMPVIRLQDQIAQLETHDQVEIHCTDPGVLNDIPAWCRINGHRIDHIEQLEHEIIILVSKQHND